MEENVKAIVEAALYAAGRPLTIDQISKIAGVEGRLVKKIVLEIMKEYRERDSAIEIVELPGSRYAMQLKAAYSSKVKDLVPGGLLSLGELKTLAYIALMQPVKQSQVIKARGSAAYAHIKRLEGLGFVRGETEGRTKILSTTELFADYFGLPYDVKKLKLQLRWRMRGLESTEEAKTN
ncbi:MAG: SMC-Scp complex subunit ScpB [Candidatus Jordarchaeales archaeon]